MIKVIYIKMIICIFLIFTIIFIFAIPINHTYLCIVQQDIDTRIIYEFNKEINGILHVGESISNDNTFIYSIETKSTIYKALLDINKFEKEDNKLNLEYIMFPKMKSNLEMLFGNDPFRKLN